MPEGPMKVEPLAGFGALDESRWNALLDRAQHPSLFLTWQWQTAWTRAFLGGRPLQLLTVSDDAGALAGILPLYEEGSGVRRFIGGPLEPSFQRDLATDPGRLAHCHSEWKRHRIRASHRQRRCAADLACNAAPKCRGAGASRSP